MSNGLFRENRKTFLTPTNENGCDAVSVVLLIYLCRESSRRGVLGFPSWYTWKRTLCLRSSIESAQPGKLWNLMTLKSISLFHSFCFIGLKLFILIIRFAIYRQQQFMGLKTSVSSSSLLRNNDVNYWCNFFEPERRKLLIIKHNFQ